MKHFWSNEDFKSYKYCPPFVTRYNINCCKSNCQAIAQSNYFGLSIQSKSSTNMRLTIQIRIQFSRRIDNPIQIQSQSNYFWKKIWDSKYKMAKFNDKTHWIPKRQLLSTDKLNNKLLVPNFLFKSGLASLLEHETLWNLNFLIK